MPNWPAAAIGWMPRCRSRLQLVLQGDDRLRVPAEGRPLGVEVLERAEADDRGHDPVDPARPDRVGDERVVGDVAEGVEERLRGRRRGQGRRGVTGTSVACGHELRDHAGDQRAVAVERAPGRRCRGRFGQHVGARAPPCPGAAASSASMPESTTATAESLPLEGHAEDPQVVQADQAAGGRAGQAQHRLELPDAVVVGRVEGRAVGREGDAQARLGEGCPSRSWPEVLKPSAKTVTVPSGMTRTIRPPRLPPRQRGRSGRRSSGRAAARPGPGPGPAGRASRWSPRPPAGRPARPGREARSVTKTLPA